MANSSTALLKTYLLYRVKEVVQYYEDNDTYVILNIHWDNGYNGNNGSGLCNRDSNTLFDQQVLESLIEGSTR